MQLLKLKAFPQLFYTTHDGLQCSSLRPPVVILPIYTYATFHPVLLPIIRSHHSDIWDDPQISEVPGSVPNCEVA